MKINYSEYKELLQDIDIEFLEVPALNNNEHVPTHINHYHFLWKEVIIRLLSNHF